MLVILFVVVWTEVVGMCGALAFQCDNLIR